ncbi:MAG TPA: hypothetical protein VJ870_02505 [Amycolatopsis sp.]|nr:hypothetical protein [Amycolatopsis sp.]
MDGVVVLIVIALFVIIGGGAVAGFHLKDKRWQRVHEFAVRHDWAAVEEDSSLAQRYGGKPFDRGRSRRARNVVRGTHRGRPFVAFEYSYSDGENTHTYGVYAVGLGETVPVLEVRERGVRMTLLRLVGLEGVRTGDIEFDQRFAVEVGDEPTVGRLLTPPVRAQLLQGWHPATARLRFEGAELWTWTRGHAEPEDLLPVLDYLCAVAGAG